MTPKAATTERKNTIIMASYHETLNNLFNLASKRGMHCSLSTIEKLAKIYNHPETAFRSIHVAGTNGKGSVCKKIFESLKAQGYRVGLYTSPHISTFRERIQIDQDLISEEELAFLLIDIQNTLKKEQIEASFFEIGTLLAFLYFQKKAIDVAVIETGLGGRWDATNIVSPILSIITSIGFDHTDVLGTSLEQIAREKAGIIKNKTPILIGPTVPYAIIEPIALAHQAPLYQMNTFFKDYDLENTEIARLGLTVISSHFPVSEAAKKEGLSKVPPCRFERYRFDKEVVFDVAHNEQGFERLLEKLTQFYPKHHYRFIVGFSKEKEISKLAKSIQGIASRIHIISGPHPRLSPAEVVATFFKKSKAISIEESITYAVEQAMQEKSSHPEVIVICGSFFIMHEAKEALGLTVHKDPYIWYDPMRIVLT